eukprot:superscaffoldBa00003430_g16929
MKLEVSQTPQNHDTKFIDQDKESAPQPTAPVREHREKGACWQNADRLDEPSELIQCGQTFAEDVCTYVDFFPSLSAL